MFVWCGMLLVFSKQKTADQMRISDWRSGVCSSDLTGLTHSIEVAQIAGSISRALGLNEDLAEAVALAHDLGHTCFGHAGEDALKQAMAPYGGLDRKSTRLNSSH